MTPDTVDIAKPNRSQYKRPFCTSPHCEKGGSDFDKLETFKLSTTSKHKHRLACLFLLSLSFACSTQLTRLSTTTPPPESPQLPAFHTPRPSDSYFLYSKEEPNKIFVFQTTSGARRAVIDCGSEIKDAWVAGNFIYARCHKVDSLFRANTGARVHDFLQPLELIGISGDGEFWTRSTRTSFEKQGAFKLETFVGRTQTHDIAIDDHVGPPIVSGGKVYLPWGFQSLSLIQGGKERNRIILQEKIHSLALDHTQGLLAIVEHAEGYKARSIQPKEPTLTKWPKDHEPCLSLMCGHSPGFSYSSEETLRYSDKEISISKNNSVQETNTLLTSTSPILRAFRTEEGFGLIRRDGKIVCANERSLSHADEGVPYRRHFDAALIPQHAQLHCRW